MVRKSKGGSSSGAPKHGVVPDDKYPEFQAALLHLAMLCVDFGIEIQDATTALIACMDAVRISRGVSRLGGRR